MHLTTFIHSHTFCLLFIILLASPSFEVSIHFCSSSSDCHLHLTLTTSEQIYFLCPFRSIPLWHLMVIPWWVVHTTAIVFESSSPNNNNIDDDNDVDAKTRYMTITIIGMCTMNKHIHTHSIHISWNLSHSIVQIVELSSILSVAIILIIRWNYIWHRFELASEQKTDKKRFGNGFWSFWFISIDGKRTKNYSR